MTPHAEVVFGGDVHRSAKLGPVRRAVGVVTDHTGDGPKLPVALLQIVGGLTEGHFQGPLTFVTGHAGFGNAAGVFRVGPGAVGRLGPLLHEGVVGSLMALSTAVWGIDPRLEGRPGLSGRWVGHVVKARPVAALALDVVVAILMRSGEPRIGVGRDVSKAADRVTRLTRIRCVAAVLEGFPSVRMGGFLPPYLGSRMAAPAGGCLRRRIAVSEEPQGYVLSLAP